LRKKVGKKEVEKSWKKKVEKLKSRKVKKQGDHLIPRHEGIAT
jgi:hypothetical protein